MRYLLFIILVFTTNSFAQDITIKRIISWGANKKVKYNIDDTTASVHYAEYLFFDDAVYYDPDTLIPYYYELIELDKYYQSDSFIITDQIYSPVNDADIKNVRFLNKIPEKLNWESSVQYMYKKPYLIFKVLPLLRKMPGGDIERLVSFTVRQITDESDARNAIKTKSAVSYSNNSVLAGGKWCKIKIPQSGVYKLTYSDILAMDLSEPSNIRIYGNGGKKLPYMNYEPRPDDIIENAIYLETGDDPDFNEGDYILFYAEGPVTWEYDTTENIFKHAINPYSDASYYFATTDLGPGKRIGSEEQVNDPFTHNLNSFDDYAYHERNIFNLVKSGRHWLGGKIENASFDTTFYFPGLVMTSPVILKTNVASRAGQSRLITIKYDNNVVDQISDICPQPVKLSWITGKARLEIPWLGTINLLFEDIINGKNTVSNVHEDSIISLVIVIAILIAIPIVLDLRDHFKKSKGPEDYF